MNSLEFTPEQAWQNYQISITQTIDIEPFDNQPLHINDPRITQVLRVYERYEPVLLGRATPSLDENDRGYYFESERTIGLCVTMILPPSSSLSEGSQDRLSEYFSGL